MNNPREMRGSRKKTVIHLFLNWAPVGISDALNVIVNLGILLAFGLDVSTVSIQRNLEDCGCKNRLVPITSKSHFAVNTPASIN